MTGSAPTGSPDRPREMWTKIAVAAAFTGVRFLPWWLAIATNDAAPKLEIGPGAIRYRVLRTRERKFDEIASVEFRTLPGTVNICFAFKDRALTFTANVRTLEEASRALKLLQGQVPFGERARNCAIG